MRIEGLFPSILIIFSSYFFHPSADNVKTNIDRLIERTELLIQEKKLVKLTLSAPKDKSTELKKLLVSIVEIKNVLRINIIYRYKTKDVTKNYDLLEGLVLIKENIESEFNNVELIGTAETINLYTLPNGKVQLKQTQHKEQQLAISLKHNHQKLRLISTENNLYLKELHVLNSQYELRREMSDKYRQINKYIELLSPYIKELDQSEPLHIADMGSGKGYLTFALYDYITNTLKRNTFIKGIEFRKELVDTCNQIANNASFEQLQFIEGSIKDTSLSKLDVLIALHACDTATDDAIYKGIKADARLIVCAPCCHKQIRKEMNANNVLNQITKFGILKERQAEILTDTLRALIMESHGYKTNIFEFISMEHTPKNLMIVGVKCHKTAQETETIKNRILELKHTFGIQTHYLETLFEKK